MLTLSPACSLQAMGLAGSISYVPVHIMQERGGAHGAQMWHLLEPRIEARHRLSVLHSQADTPGTLRLP